MRVEPERMDQAVTEHTELLDALRGDDVTRWTERVEQHIGTAALRLRTARSADGPDPRSISPTRGASIPKPRRPATSCSSVRA